MLFRSRPVDDGTGRGCGRRSRRCSSGWRSRAGVINLVAPGSQLSVAGELPGQRRPTGGRRRSDHRSSRGGRTELSDRRCRGDRHRARRAVAAELPVAELWSGSGSRVRRRPGGLRRPSAVRTDALPSDFFGLQPYEGRDRTFGLDDDAFRSIAHGRFRPGVLEGRPAVTDVMLGFHFGLR